jgi:hypothetical protein
LINQEAHLDFEPFSIDPRDHLDLTPAVDPVNDLNGDGVVDDRDVALEVGLMH